jgi:hypothetical protein
VALSKDLENLIVVQFKAGATKTMVIPTKHILNVTSTSMFGVNSPPEYFKDKRILSIMVLLAENPKSRPESIVMYFFPDTKCVQLGEVVELTEQDEDGGIQEKLGLVLGYDRTDPDIVHVQIGGTNEVVDICSDTLMRNDDEESLQLLRENARTSVWNWFSGLSKLKRLIGIQNRSKLPQAVLDDEKKYLEEKRTLGGRDRTTWHKEHLICGNIFPRAFVGRTLKRAKVILGCYVRVCGF